MGTPVGVSSPQTCASRAYDRAASLGYWAWQKADHLRHRDGLVAGTAITSLLGLATIASLAYRSTPLSLAGTAVTLGLAKFFGGKDGILSVFTDYLRTAMLLNRSVCKPTPKHGPSGIWLGTGIDVQWSQFTDPRLAEEIAKLLTEGNIKTAWDFGCGLRDAYTKVLVKNGIDCNGLDGNPEVETFSKGTAFVQDLADPFKREKRDCVISLEVGAKIPEVYVNRFLENISNHAKNMIIISWPIKGQKGPNQLNPQGNGYVIKKLDALGWKPDAKDTLRLRENSHPIFYWFQDTIMVFRRKMD